MLKNAELLLRNPEPIINSIRDQIQRRPNKRPVCWGEDGFDEARVVLIEELRLMARDYHLRPSYRA